MFRLKGRDLHISRTQSGIVTIKSKKQITDGEAMMKLRIYEVNGLDAGYLKEIDGKIAEDKMSVSFTFAGSDTEIEEDISNEILTYWYEIRIGEKVIGYDEQKARLLYVYPSGSEFKKEK
jgi:hypothetical protein